MNNGVFIPMEIMRREYISKLLLSVILMKKGMPVIIGHKDYVFDLALKTNEPGIIFYKAMMYGQKQETFKKLKQKKFGVIAQDEEAGIIYENFEDFYRIRKSMALTDQLDLFFAWGNDDYHFLTKKFSKNIVKNYGALRSCFWGDFGRRFYKSTIQNLKKKYGDYILFVTNFGTYNSDLGKNKSLKTHINYRGFDLEKYKNIYKNEKKTFFQYLELINFITKQTGKKVIVRPHPREDVKEWKRALKGIKNTCIEKKGELIPLILGSELIIQNNCTSAIEAAASKIPVLTYVDTYEDLYCLSEGKENIPNKLSLNIFGKEELNNAIKNIDLLWNKDANKKQREEILNRKIKYNGTIKAAENIAQKIIEYVGTPNPKGNQDIGKDSILHDVHEFYRILKYKLRFNSSLMDGNKRETLSYHNIERDISNFLDIMNIKQKAKIKRVERNTFYLYPLER
jgi:surface carbohydrate biosynthesis protein